MHSILYFFFVSNHTAAQEVVKAIQVLGGEAEAIQADVADRSAVQAMVDRTVERFTTIDVLVNNAAL